MLHVHAEAARNTNSAVEELKAKLERGDFCG